MAKLIDINCDLGEGYGNDALLMPYLSSCNIACGGHFGDFQSMLDTVQLAKKYQVKVGAHPSFPDRENFGRQLMQIDDQVLQDSIYDQVMDFKAVCNQAIEPIHHIKLHGALYNLAAQSADTATIVMEALIKTGIHCKLYAPYQSELSKINQNQFDICYEAFIDRNYHANLNLVSRSESNAIITAPELAWQQFYQMVTEQSVTSVEGQKSTILASTFCIHGDQDNAVAILAYIHQQLQRHNLSFK